MNHNRRDVIVIDIDNSEDSIAIPVSYKFQNPESGHRQAGLLLNTPCFDTERYIELTHTINTICRGDKRYTGWQCKNPYYFNAEWTGLTFDFSELYARYSSPIYSSPLSYMKMDSFEGHQKAASSSSSLSYMKMDTLKEGMMNGEDSRHFHIMDKVNRFVWGNDAKVSLEETIEYMLNINTTIGKICNKEPEQEDEIIRQVYSLYPWAIEHYEAGKKPNHAPTIDDIEKWHEKALEARRRNRDYKIDKLRELIVDLEVQVSYRYIQKKMKELFDIKVSRGWIGNNLPSLRSSILYENGQFQSNCVRIANTDFIRNLK
ncbi:hypothetical protein FACS1894142_5010 [Spirochaetia bacterium]|nr:hypothetical protein FACS1894142_5010 [Spirochaetia bacterium]